MASISNDSVHQSMETIESGETVVVSGMSGLFPDSHHVKDLANILYEKINPISSNPSWKCNQPEVARYMGKVPNLDLFDAQFFKVHYKLGNRMDPMSRKLLEQAYQAIYDAGISPVQLAGRNVGVYIGITFTETEKKMLYSYCKNGFAIMGCSKSMFANRISYWLNLKGPSISIDESCCSSIAALEQAYLAISRGECEAAIVGGANICLLPQSSVHYGRLMCSNLNGKTKSFDENASGCVKSEAINVLFIQKAKDALRIYARVVHVKSQFIGMLEDQTGPIYGFYRNSEDITLFLNNFYKKAGVPPQSVEYVEAFGSAVPEADKSELESLEAVFCKNRDNELLVGSVMSNIGYGEAASGISAVTKVLLGFHYGILAANLNCDNPRRDVIALRDGRMRILTEHKQFGRTYAAVNALSVTGVNAHILLHGHYKPKDHSRYKSNIPYLVTISARQDFSVQNIFDRLKSQPIDPEELGLLHNIHESSISGHLGRGFTILDTNKEQETVSLCAKTKFFDKGLRPLWFVYSGMGSQWAGMGTQLMRIPIFAIAINRCHKVLEPKGIDVVSIITSPDKTTFDNILNSFIGIAAVQIGLTDILRELGLVPDNIIGHSVGELGCAYADGCITAEEMILAAYYRGLVSVQADFIRGSMAAVGIGYQEVVEMCPPEIDVACHNGPESSTISGPANIMKEFVEELKSRQIFAKEVPCSNIAYHSRYIAKAGPELLKHLKEVIKSPKPRSARWLSTSVPQHMWNDPRAKTSSAEYHTNNLLNPVLFEETSRLIPSNALLIEVAPHGLLQAILKRSLPESCYHVPLTNRCHVDNIQFFLEAIGTLYMEGYYPKVKALYPKIEFPVSTGTPLLSHLVEWAHYDKWSDFLFASSLPKAGASCKFVYTVHDDENKYLAGNILGGKTKLPFAAALVATWDTLAMTIGVPKKQLSVQFQDLKFYNEPYLYDQHQLRLFVSLHRGTGLFEVMDENTKVVTGYITGEIVDVRQFYEKYDSSEELILKTEDIYQLFFKRGYDYRGEFRVIYRANRHLTEAQLYWRNNWVTLIDGILQLNGLRQQHDSVSVPTHIRKLVIDVEKHFKSLIPLDINDSLITAQVFEKYNLVRCGGVAIEDIKSKYFISTRTDANLMVLKFVPLIQEAKSDIFTAFLVFVQAVAENLNKTTINIIEISHNEDSLFRACFNNIPNIVVHYKIIHSWTVLEENVQSVIDVDILLGSNISNDDKIHQTLYRVLSPDTFLIDLDTCPQQSALNRCSPLYSIISSHRVNDQSVELLRWRPSSSAVVTSVFTVRSSADLVMLTSTLAVLPPQHRLVVIAPYPPIDGLKNVVQKWKKARDQIKVVMMSHQLTEYQDLDELKNLNLTFNILNNGRWGGMFFVPLQQNISTDSEISLQCLQAGHFDSLTWVEMPNINGSGVKVSVHYAGINNNDIQQVCNGSGMFPNIRGQNGFGMDFSGVTESGDRVMGLFSGGAVSSCVLAQHDLLWPVPKHWSLEEAATVPLAYGLALYFLCIKYKIRPGMTIFINGGAGALGQAVITIALKNGCRVFTTVSDESKKLYLLKLFPELKEDQIGNSYDHSFADMVLLRTNRYGCNFVITCAIEEFKNISYKLAADFGIIVDLTQISAEDNIYFGMSNLSRERSYTTIDFRKVIEQEAIRKNLQLLLSEGITRGFVRPLTRMIYSPLEVSCAFKLVATRNHRGRLLLQLRAQVDESLSPPVEIRLHLNANSSHFILCNNNYLGLHLAERLVKRGARKIYLHGLKQSAFVDFEIRALQNVGAYVEVCNDVLKSENYISNLINKINNLGCVEGIYYIGTDKQGIFKSNEMRMLDLISRKLCPYLRYFGIIGSTADNDLDSLLMRSQDKLPVTKLILPPVEKMDVIRSSGIGTITERDAINFFEIALKSNESVLLANLHLNKCHLLFDEITRIAGVKVSDKFSETTTLSDLDIGLDKSQLILNFLSDVYNISLPEKDVLNLTIKRLNEIQRNDFNWGHEKYHGLSAFYSYVDPDDLHVTTEMVFLPTLGYSSEVNDNEFNATQTYLCLIPGLEGHSRRFYTLCERLKIPAMVLQPGVDHPDESVNDLANRYTQILLKKTILKGHFYLMGYESGALVALEMAAILEKQGLVGTVFLIGETPDKFHVTLKNELKEYSSDEILQTAVVKHFFNLMVGENTSWLEKKLATAKTWAEKIDICTSLILGKVPYSMQYARALINCAYGRIKQVQAYRPTARAALRSKLILINALESAGSCEHSLQNYSQQPVSVYQLNTPLAQSAADLRCTTIINNHLDSKLIEEFNNKNLCYTYLIDDARLVTSGTDEKL